MNSLEHIINTLELFDENDVSTYLVNGEKVTNLCIRYTIDKGYKRDYDPTDKIQELKEKVFSALGEKVECTNRETMEDTICKFFEETYPINEKDVLFLTVFIYDEFVDITFSVNLFESMEEETIIKEKNGFKIGDVIFNPENDYDYKYKVSGFDSEHIYGRSLNKEGQENKYDFVRGDFTEDGLYVYGELYEVLKD